MAELFLTRTMNGLEARDQDAVHALRKLKLGTVVRATITKPRSLAHHRRFFAMLQTVWQACGDWKSTEELLIELKFRVGHVERQKVLDRATGEEIAEIITPRSISFAEMDDTEFREFTERCIRVICDEMVPGLDDQALRDEVLRSVA